MLAIKRFVRMPVTDGPHETPEFCDEGVPFVSAESVWDGRVHLASMRGFISESAHKNYSKKYRPKRSDILIVKSGSTTGKVAMVDFDDEFNVWSPLAAVRCATSEAFPRFIFYSLGSSYFQDLIQVSWSFGTQPNIGMGVIANLAVILPPLPEQRAIADFLDKQTSKLNLLIAKKQQLIEKLEEKRSALISRTVTRGLPPQAARAVGLDPQPKLKPSGIEWLGDVPARWEVKPIFRLSETIQTGPFGSQLHESDYVEGGIPLINPAHLIGGTLAPDDDSAVDEKTAVRLSRHRMRVGDIVMGRRGEIGRCGVIKSREQGWLCGTGSLLIRLRDSDPRYYVRLISSAGFIGWLELNAVGTTMLNLSPGIVGRMRVPVPPWPEQRLIADFLDCETAKIDAMIAKAKEAIERLQEYRAALITATVTGDIDVQNADIGRSILAEHGGVVIGANQ